MLPYLKKMILADVIKNLEMRHPQLLGGTLNPPTRFPIEKDRGEV